MRISSLAVLMLSTVAAMAQAPTAYSDAQRARDEEIARRYIQTIVAPSPGLATQYSRWSKPVCLSVYGLAPTTTQALESNVRAIARKVGAPVDTTGNCEANVTIVFTATPQAMLDSLAKTKPILPSGDRPKPVMIKPIQVWYSNYVHDYQGKRIKDQAMGDSIFFQLTDNLGPGMTDSTGVAGMRTRSNVSHLRTGVFSELEGAIILVDTRAVSDGMSIGSLGDYLALTALAQVRTTGRCREVLSMANLLADGCAPGLKSAGLANTDIAMLTALYQTSLEPEMLHQQRLISAMRQNLENKPGR